MWDQFVEVESPVTRGSYPQTGQCIRKLEVRQKRLSVCVLPFGKNSDELIFVGCRRLPFEHLLPVTFCFF